MTSIENLFLKFLANPASLRYFQIERLLLNLGFEQIQAKGSHVKFKHHDLRDIINIPVHNDDCKAIYKFKIAKIIKTKPYPGV